MLGRFAVLALAVAGCDQVFGIREVATNDAAPDPMRVTGRFHQLYAMNDTSFAPRVGERIYPVGSIAFDAILDDESHPAVDYQADGTFTFSLVHEGQAYRLVFTVDGVRGEIQHSATQLRLATLVAGRPDRLAVTATTVSLPYPLATATNLPAIIATTGVYTFSNTNMFGPTVTFDWRLSTPAQGGATGMLDASKYDRAYALEFVTDTTSIPNTSWSRIAAVSSASITQSQGFTAMLPQPAPVTRNTCARFSASNVAEYNRIANAAPRAFSYTYGNWVLWMVPAPDVLGIPGAMYVGLCTFRPVRDVDVAPTFYDTFIGTTLIVQSFAAGYFDVTLPGATALVIPNGTSRFHKVERGNPASCTSAKENIGSSVGIPSGFLLDGVALDTDGKQIALDLTHDVPLAWQLGADGPVDAFNVSLHELTIVNGATTNIARLGISVAGTTARIDPAFLVPGHRYIIAITAQLGRPNVAQGDFETLALPWENSVTWSHYFEVKAR